MRLAIGMGVAGWLSFATAAPTQWTPTGGQIDEVVADTSMAAPPHPLQRITAPIPFSNFRYPYVEENGDVIFIADDPAHGGGANHGIYRSRAADGKLIPLVTHETLVPGTDARFDYIRGLQVGDNGRDFVFQGNDTSGGTGIYLWRDGALLPVARARETALPGAVGTVTGLDYASLSGSRVLYVAETASAVHLVLFEVATRAQRVLLSTGATLPGAEGDAQLRYLSPQNWIAPAGVAFRAARVKNPRAVSNDGTGQRGIYGWIGEDAQNFAPERLRRLVDWNTPVPGFPGKGFTDLRCSPVGDGFVAFTAAGDGFSGVYWVEAESGRVEVIADTDTALPGLFEGTFRSFPKFISVIGHDIIFTASAKNGFEGVFLYRPRSEELLLLTDNRNPVEGKRIHRFEIAGRCLLGNRLAVAAVFADESAGVFLATIPEQSLRRSDATAVERE